MNRHYQAFIELGRSLLLEKSLTWDFQIDNEGNAVDGIGWNLTKVAKAASPPIFYLRDLGFDSKVLRLLNTSRVANGLPAISRKALSPSWQDFIKATVAEQLFLRKNSPGHVQLSVARPLRVIATCVEKEPWAITIDDFRLAINVASEAQASGKLGDLISGLIKVVFDSYHICDAGQMYSMIGVDRLSTNKESGRAKHTLSNDELRANLEERKQAEKLPAQRAFWELVRIVMTERPKTFMDEIRFLAVKTMIFTGLRAGETALLPLDWKRERSYVDSAGRPAGESGGISSSLMLRHFAEKQQQEYSDSRILRENCQAVPEIFRGLLCESLERAAQLTFPLRDTLKLQCETGRIFPWYDEREIVPFPELYSRITGNPFWLDIDRSPFIDRYREKFDPGVFSDLHAFLSTEFGKSKGNLDRAAYKYGNYLQKVMKADETGLRFRKSDGSVLATDQRLSWAETYLKISELESYIRNSIPSKLSDSTPLLSERGAMQPWEFFVFAS